MILETGYFLIWSSGVLFSLIVLYNFVKNHSFVTVNCWFCNTNFRIPFKNRKEWFCEQCLQFNGFKEDGDYSKVLPEQFDETLNRKYVKTESSQTSYVFNSNGLCSFCNANQELKIKQLALYVPFHEKNYDEEIEIFKKKLEKSYKLCENCENFVHKKLQLKSGPGLSTDGVKVYKNATDRHIPARKYFTKSKILPFLFMVIGTVVACVFRTRSSIEHVAELFASYDFEQFLPGVRSPMCYGLVLDYFFVLSTAFLPYIFLVRLQSIVGILLVMLSLMISDDLIPVWKILSIVAVVIAIAIKSIVSDRMKRRCTLQKLNYNLQNRFDLEYEKKEDCEMKRSMAKSNSSASFYGNAPLCGQFSDLNLGKCEKRVPSWSKQSPPHSFKCDKLLIQPSKLKIDEFDYADTLRTSPTVSSGYESLCGGFFKKTPDSDFEFDSISQVNIATREHLFPNVSKNHSPPYTRQSHFQTMDALSFSGGAERYYGAIPIHSSSSLCWPGVNGYISKCSDNGFKCASCEELIHCVGIPTNSFKVSLINYCDNSKGQYCSMEKGSCVNDANACQIFGLKTLHCEDTGAFPDPYDCNSYHMCIKQDDAWISTKHNCPEDRAFDPLTATCRFKLTHRVCQEKPVEPCMRPLQHGPILENPNIYFVCVQNDDVHDRRLEPRLYKCKPGHIYSEHACIESTSISSSEMKFVCEKPGNFADPRNCYRYFECDGDLKSAHKTCRPGTYFDPKEATCVKGTC